VTLVGLSQISITLQVYLLPGRLAGSIWRVAQAGVFGLSGSVQRIRKERIQNAVIS